MRKGKRPKMELNVPSSSGSFDNEILLRRYEKDVLDPFTHLLTLSFR